MKIQGFLLERRNEMNPIDFGNSVVWMAGLIMSVWGVLGIIQKIIEMAKKPEKNQNIRMDQHEVWLKEHDEKIKEFEGFFRNDKTRLNQMEEGNRIQQKALLALLSHGIDGNNIEPLKKAKAEMEKYLINR
jgi:hypothetical protein